LSLGYGRRHIPSKNIILLFVTFVVVRVVVKNIIFAMPD
jgi:hypothetical protein